MIELEKLKDELETVSFRLNCLVDEIQMKSKEADEFYRRKIAILEKLSILENEV